MKKITVKDLETLRLGASILSSGGGSDPKVGLLSAKHNLEKYGDINLIKVEELSDDAIVAPIAYIGAPATYERLHDRYEFDHIFQEIKNYYGKAPNVVMAGEIGGANAFVPFTISGRLNIPVLDADGTGRAFPQIQMVSFSMHNLFPKTMFFSDPSGNTAIITTRNNSDNSKMMENIARHVTVSLGSNAAMAFGVFTGKEIKRSVVEGSVSHAIHLGKTLQENTIEEFVKQTKSTCIGTGIIQKIESQRKNGFLFGKTVIIDEKSTNKLEIDFQNENIVVRTNGKITGSSPDVITVFDSKTKEPISNGIIKEKMHVNVIVIPGNNMWKTENGLELVGPKAFGF